MKKTRPSREKIARAVCRVMDCNWQGGVKSSKKSDRLSIARGLIVIIACETFDYTLGEIAEYAGYGSVSGAHYARERIQRDDYEKSPVLKSLGASSVAVLRANACVQMRKK